MSEQSITLYSPGSLPGIPGEHAPGSYFVDYETRTIRPAVDMAETPVEAQPPAEEAPMEPALQTQSEEMPEVVTVPDLPQDTPAQESI